MITKEQALKCMTTVEHMRHHTAAFSNASEKLRQFIEQQPDSKPSAQVPEVKMRLTSGEDGVFVHFQIGDGYQCGINLDHEPLCKRFCNEYRAMLNQSQEG